MSKDHYYVYVLFDWQGIPRYVGCGSQERWLDHEHYKRDPNELKGQFIKDTMSRLGEIPKLKIRENLSRDAGLEIEEALITAIGRLNVGTGPLTNLTNGGMGLRGVVTSDATRKKLSENSRRFMMSMTPEERAEFCRPGGKAAGQLLWINDGAQQRRVSPEISLSSGWKRGRLYDPVEHFKNAAKNTIWINNGFRTARHNIDQPIPDGWTTGRKLRSRVSNNNV